MIDKSNLVARLQFALEMHAEPDEIEQLLTEISRLNLRNAQLETLAEKLKRLIIAVGMILGHGTPGDAWIDWTMRVQSVLGLEFYDGRYKDRKAVPFDEIREYLGDMPRVTVRELKAAAKKATIQERVENEPEEIH